jgi:nucleoside-diphosphate-sugar epimerase
LNANPKTLLIGCGYIGLPLALRLKEAGHEISAWVHSPESAEALAPHQFHRVIAGSVAEPRLWDSVPENYQLVIHCASSGGGSEADYEQVFLKGVLMMNTRQPRARRLFVSSTSVYRQNEGEVVTEKSNADPATATGRVLRVAEKVAMGEAVIEGDGLRWINQIHQGDLVAAIFHLIDSGTPGEIYNATDDTPVTYRDYYAWCSKFLGQPMPPHGPVNTERKRGLTNKRVSNAKLRALGWTPVYPSFREGLAANHGKPAKIPTS